MFRFRIYFEARNTRISGKTDEEVREKQSRVIPNLWLKKLEDCNLLNDMRNKHIDTFWGMKIRNIALNM